MAWTTFGSLASGNVAASLLDDNFNAILGQSAQQVGSISGSANAITGATNPVLVLALGQLYLLIPGANNSGATTLALNGGAAKNVYANGVACAGGELTSGVPALLWYDGIKFNIVGQAKKPTRTTLTSGSGTYTTPSGCTRFYLRMVGAGSGGGANGAGATSGSAGGDTTFGAYTAGGGHAGATSNATPVAGGTCTGGDFSIVGGQGGAGSSTTLDSPGGQGGSAYFGGGGASGGPKSGVGQDAPANSGAGGGGAGGSSTGTAVNACSGGSAGGYLEKLVTSPSASYAYGVGAGGNGGAGGTGGSAGGKGGSGIIVIDEYYS